MHFFPGIGLLIGLLVLIFVGAVMTVLAGLIILLLPAAFLAFLVLMVTGKLLLAGSVFFLFGVMAVFRRIF
jgi:hypothetical protein